MAETKQISATIDIDTANNVQALADEEKRSFSEMVGILLDKAIKAVTLPTKSKERLK